MLRAFLFLLCVAGTQYVIAQRKSQQKVLESEFSALMHEWGMVGLSVVAVKEGQIVYKHQFGFQDRERNIPLNDQSIFRIASISKSFSAVAVMQLIEAG